MLDLLRLLTIVAFCAMSLWSTPVQAEVRGWKTTKIHGDFYAEGAAVGDLNGDGHADLTSGPFVFLGPEFNERIAIDEPQVFPVAGYSNAFFSHVVDLNRDGKNDVLVIGFPGREARAYLNPGDMSSDTPWQKVVVADQVSNESPAFVDLIAGGLPEIVCSRDTAYGYYEAGDDPLQPWQWHAISETGIAPKPFGHGLGVGDVNQDGRLDIVDRTSWWKQPENPQGQWPMQRWCLGECGRGGAQIHVVDVDGDGDQDIVTSLNAHGYGLAWFERQSEARFERHDIMGETSILSPYGVAVSQLHAVEMVDVDGDGLKDIITGKRWKAHNGHDPGSREPAAVYWFRCVRSDDGVDFVPHLIHNNSGVGTEVKVQDLNGDDYPDVVSSSKKGLSIHLQSTEVDPVVAEKWRFPHRPVEEYTNGFSPEDAAKNMQVPEGFSVDLIVAEPELTQPIAMCFDARGRIWVIEGHTYPQRAPEGQGRDRILILEDTDGDGSFESRKVFAENINLASGIEIGFGGVWVGAAPQFLFYPDRDQNDVPDSEPVVLLDGWGYQDTHETLNSFTWGPDGWLYGCHGVFTHSRVGKPGTPDEQRIPINAGVWRYHPTRHEFEVFAHGSSNPWGVDFNEDGDWFITACVIPHLYHVIPGARYFRQAGTHFNPHTYADLPTIADHLHYGDGTFASASNGKVNRGLVRDNPASTSDVGGGHAHCGLTIYQADEFPSQYRGDLFFHNLHGHRMVRETVEPDGSGYVGRHRPDFSLSHDHQQIGVTVMQGPDGALYTSDWHDPQTCHNRTPEIWNRTDGRLFRIRYGDLKPYRFNLWEKSDAELVKLLDDPNAFYARQAQRILQERAAEGTLNQAETLASLRELMGDDHPRVRRLRAFWTAWSCQLLDTESVEEKLDDADPVVRSWAVQFLVESGKGVEAPVLQRLEELAKSEPEARTRLALAAQLQRLPVDQRWGVLEGLTSHRSDELDKNIPLLVWYGAEPLADVDPVRLLNLARKSGWKQLTQFVVRRMSSSEEGRNLLTEMLMPNVPREFVLLVLNEMQAIVISRAGAPMPGNWRQAVTDLQKRSDAEIDRLVLSLGIRFGDESAFPHFRSLVRDRSKPFAARRDALQLLAEAKDPELASLALELLDDPALRSESIRALARVTHPEAASRLLSVYGQLPPNQKTEVLNVLVSRKGYAESLINAMETGAIDPTTVPAYIVRQVVSLDDEKLLTRLEKVWGKIGTASGDKEAAFAKYRKLLQPRAITGAHLGEGRKLYEANCGKCHRLFGKGGEIGPEITGANRSNIDYWLENILEPNAVIGRNYLMTTFVTTDGRVVNGLIKSENDSAVTIQTVNEVLVLALDDIEIRKTSDKSLMPENQLEPMTDAQVLQLFRYLTATEDAATSKEVQLSRVPPVEPGVLRIEGEAIASSAKLTAGNVRPQPMGGFGPYWSGGNQLWWTGGEPGDKLTIKLQKLPPGPSTVTCFTTTAKDYGQVSVKAGEAVGTADLYTADVLPGPEIVLENVKVEESGELTLTVEITGTHPKSLPRFMVGIDRIEVRPVASNPTNASRE